MSIGGNSGKSDMVKMCDWPMGTHSYILGVLCQALTNYEQVDRDAAFKYNWAGKACILGTDAVLLVTGNIGFQNDRLLGLVTNIYRALAVINIFDYCPDAIACEKAIM